MRCTALVVFVWLLVTVPAAAQQLAFSTAEGFGRFAQGGRGGRAYLINSTSPNPGTGGSCNAGGCSGGTITFSDCLQDRFGVGARTCIFRVGGTINWSTFGPAVPPYLTIAGQTAPGDGILIRNMQFKLQDTHNIIVRHLRVRPGASNPDPASFKAILVWFSHDVMLDHVSAGWDTDDTIDFADSYKVTLQWSLVSEGMDVAGDGDNSKVVNYSPKGVDSETTGGSVLHNLLVNHGYRCPNNGSGWLQFVNNVVYNVPGGSMVTPVETAIHAQYVNNYYNQKSGESDQTRLNFYGCGTAAVNCTHAGNSAVYLSGNFHDQLRPNNTFAQDSFVNYVNDPIAVASTPFTFPAIASQTSATQALTDVLNKSGAYAVAGGTATVRRDSIDQRAVNDATTGTTGNAFLEDESQVGGYPTYSSGTPYTDTDSDGMSDAWETAHGLNPANAADGPALAANGYSNLENFLNELAGDTPTTPTEPDMTTNLVAYYRFDGTPSDSAPLDGSQNGTLMNGADYTPHAKGGRALQLDGVSQFVQVADAAVLDVTGNYTLAAWVYPTSTLTDYRAVAVKNYTYFLYASSSGWCGTGGVQGGHTENFRACHATPLSPNTWTHLAVTHDGTTVRLYRNGAEVATVASGAGPGATAGTLTIGASQFGEYFPGRLDEVRLYSRALAPLDVTALHALTFPKGRRPTGQGGGTQP